MKDQMEKYEYIVESYINGQFTQVKDLFFKLRGIDNKLEFITFLKNRSNLSESERLDLTSFLLKKVVDKWLTPNK